MTSPWSATMIGIHDQGTSRPKEIFKQEAKEVAEYLQASHHSRKIAHQQVNYSDTVTKLSKMQKETPVYLQNKEMQMGMKISAASRVKLNEFYDQRRDYSVNERDINERKRLYNREMGRVSTVTKIMDGTAPLTKEAIFPQKATHTQCLAMTGKLKAPDASIVPPRMPTGKKWMGDGVGWGK